MTTNALTTAPIVHVKDGKVFANSRDVADLFGKEHRHVLRDIREKMRPNLDPSQFNAMFGKAHKNVLRDIRETLRSNLSPVDFTRMFRPGDGF